MAALWGVALTLAVLALARPAAALSTALTCAVPSPYRTAVLADAPYAWWRLGETTWSVAHDCAGGRDGTYTGTVFPGARGRPTSGAATAAPFFAGGSGGYVVLPSLPAPSSGGPTFTTAYTFEVWLQPTPGAIVDYTRIADFVYSADGGVTDTEPIALAFIAPAGDGAAVYSYQGYSLNQWTSVPAGFWTHIAVTMSWSGSVYTAIWYVNGTQAGTTSATANAAPVDGPYTINTLGQSRTE